MAAARPDAILNQMTGLSEAHAGKPNLRKADRFFAVTNRLRNVGIDHLLAAAKATGVSEQVKLVRKRPFPLAGEYVGQWFPEPLLTARRYEDPAWSAELADSVSMAALLLLERLTPLERAVFVLRRCSGSAFRRRQLPSGVRRRRAASSRSGRDATWTSGALGSRRTAGNARSWRRGSSMRSGMATSTD